MNAVGEAAVAARGLTVVRGGRTVLSDVCFDVPHAQVTGLLGPSGGGKTTLMRTIVGVQLGVTGDVTALGRPAGSPDLRDKIGYVTQAPSVYGDLTVAENLHFFARVLGVRDAEVKRCVDAVAIGDHRQDLVSRLSGGEQSRVSLAVALLGRPRLLILDEPTVGLDPVLRRDLWGIFHRLADDGVTVLVSSHVMDEAERCDRLLLLREGRLVADDTPDGLRERTGTDNLEDAFLRTVEREGAVE